MARVTGMNGTLRLLVLFGLAWNGLLGMADYVLIQLQVSPYLAVKAAFFNLPPGTLDGYYELWPQWARNAWVMNAWGGLAGSVLLAIGDRKAVWLFGLSLVGLAIQMLFFSSHYAPFPRVAGDPWGETLDTIRTIIALTSGLHALAVIVAVRRFMPTICPKGDV